MLGALKVIAYLLGAAVAARAAHRTKKDAPALSPKSFVATVRSCLNALRVRGRAAPPRAWRAFGWLVVAALSALLAVARAVDLDDLVRSLDLSAAAYASRRIVQGALVLGAAVVTLTLIAATAWRLRHTPRLAVALATAFTLVAYVAVRAVSWHAVDVVVGQFLLGVRVNTWLEAAGLTVIGAAALLDARR